MENKTRKKDVPPFCCADDEEDPSPQIMPQKSSCSGGTVLESNSRSDTWRTYDGSPGKATPVSRKSSFREPTKPIVERRIQTIVVPRERRRRGPPCGRGSSKLKWVLLALATSILIGIAYKKYVAQ